MVRDDKRQNVIDQQLEDIQRGCEVAAVTYNDPFKVFETSASVVECQRTLLFGSDG